MNTWFQNLILFLSGGFLWEGIKFAYPEVNKWLDGIKASRRILVDNLDPILKAADELYGKLVSLAKEDFSTFINERNSTADDVALNRTYVCYLFAQFWAHLEYVRIKSQYSSIARTKKGKQLIRFIETFESREFRILDRSIQRIIGEGLVESANNNFRVMSLNTFVRSINNTDSPLKNWIAVLERKLCECTDKDKRQRILVYGVIVSTLINHFDPKHKVIRAREIYTNKLSRKSMGKIMGALFSRYLNFINDNNTLYGKLAAAGLT
ncbi:hypothetical protein [Chitinophaga japonensis]|uniref:Uncharacterized protein n=1 Tax=Chitinophaga japonensis TaxID=104662 RepID=A0A562T7U1_CHIJA|nr:hypothetical protein [Chitinophaga japonensis]TWI89258.1 hypothetical protein LX66_3353 [Chitinophaga japonensis]